MTEQRRAQLDAQNTCDCQLRADRSTAEQDANNAVRAAQCAGQGAMHAARQANNRAQQPATCFSAVGFMQRHDLGHMERECPHCKALHLAHARMKGSVNTGTTSHGMCCMHGAVQ